MTSLGFCSWSLQRCITETYIFLKFKFCLKPSLINEGKYLSKLATVVNIYLKLKCFLASNISYSPSTFLYYFTHLSLFWGKMYPPPCFGEQMEIQFPFPLKCREDTSMINQKKLFHILQIKPVIIKTITFKFENVEFTKLQKKNYW